MPCVQPFFPLVVPSCHHRQWQDNVKSSQIVSILPYWCGRGCCLVTVTIPVNLLCQPVVFPCQMMTTFKMYLEFEENLQFRKKTKNISIFWVFGGTWMQMLTLWWSIGMIICTWKILTYLC